MRVQRFFALTQKAGVCPGVAPTLEIKMRRWDLAVFVCLAVPAFGFAGNLNLVPTTTLSAETSNNTSASNAFRTQTNGNLGPANVSKVDIHSLLYPGADTRIYAHMLLWFGQSNHMNIGYSSTDATEVKRQIQDMISRGIDGVIIDWYGPNNSIDQATQVVMHEAESHPGFTFAIMVDQGAIEWDSCAGCSPQQALIQQLQYLEQQYFPSRAYMRLDGAPVVGNFDIDLHYTIDWNGLKAALATAPAFIYQNSGGFTHLLSQGSDSWVLPTTSDYGMSYLQSFYQAGMSYPKEETLGGSYKGFNDSLAAWGSNRVMGQQCGATWLQTFSMINHLYSGSRQLPALQLVTWNDYEEGTEIESGIDNCVSVSASLSGSSLRWTISGNEDTIDHFVTYVSSDGNNLTPLGELAPGAHSLNLCSYALGSRHYEVLVQAVGKPTLTNHISNAVSYTPMCKSSGSNSIRLAASPSAMTLSHNHPVTSQITASPQLGAAAEPMALSCEGLPAGLACSFSPDQISPGGTNSSSRLTVSSTVARRQNDNRHPPAYLAYWMGLGALGFAGIGSLRRRQALQICLLAVLFGLMTILCSCGAGKNPMSPIQSVDSHAVYTITISGTSASMQVSTTATITVE